MTPTEFINKWKPVALTERAAAHSHFLDLCKLFEHDDPVKADPTGEWFTFEKGVTKTGGGEGFADVWKRNFFAWEYKKKKRDLNAAMDQLVRYAAALENPPLQVVCDTDRFVIRTAWTNSVTEVHEIELDDLRIPEKREILWAVFHDPEKLRPKQTRAGVTKEAADKFSTIALRLQGRGTPEEIAHFVNQLVFCFFASSVKLLPDGFFARMLKRAAENPARAQSYFNQLFEAMEGPDGEFGLDKIAWFNGGLFDGRRALPLDGGDIGLLIAAASLDWSQIDPTIFGTLFERFLDPDKRAQIGAHYTDPDKIMMIVEPVIMRPLREEWEAARGEIEALLSGKQKPPKRAKTNRTMSGIDAAEEVRSRFLERLRQVTILDPACGSGNFLYLALQGVKDIELRANQECEAFGMPARLPSVGPEIVHGLEINPLAAELARTTIWIGDIQWRIHNGIHSNPQPILRKLDTIECRDALIAKQEDGSSLEAEWPAAEFIVGNPPFLGASRMIGGLGEAKVGTLRHLFEGQVPGFADLVCFWFAVADRQIRRKRTTRVGLVATNSIRGGENRFVIDTIQERHRIFEAWSDEEWVVEGAAVRVSLICFQSLDDTNSEQLHLNGRTVNEINSDLSNSTNLTMAKRLLENSLIAFEGTKKYGRFEVPGETARQWLLNPSNVNGKPNAEVLRPWLNGRDFSGRSSGRWIIDFSNFEEREATLFEAPFRHAAEVVKPDREADRNERTRTIWWRFERERPLLRTRLAKISRYICTTRHSKFRLFAWVPSVVIPDSAIVAVTRDDDVTFGILHSRFHEAWSLRLGSSLEDRPRYTPTTTFETFPFPEGLAPNIPAADYTNEPRAIAIAKTAKRLNDLRNVWLNPPELVRTEPEVVPSYPDRILPKDAQAAVTLKTRTLTNLYNQRPQWLVDAHWDLDAAVAAAYGWPADISEEDALSKLLELNLARAGNATVLKATEAEADDE